MGIPGINIVSFYKYSVKGGFYVIPEVVDPKSFPIT
jgi:hypothetical protein